MRDENTHCGCDLNFDSGSDLPGVHVFPFDLEPRPPIFSNRCRGKCVTDALDRETVIGRITDGMYASCGFFCSLGRRTGAFLFPNVSFVGSFVWKMNC